MALIPAPEYLFMHIHNDQLDGRGPYIDANANIFMVLHIDRSPFTALNPNLSRIAFSITQQQCAPANTHTSRFADSQDWIS
jgi:hypothetical protein